jgi:hypothetical protein
MALICCALAAYERTLVSFDSPFDHFIAGDQNAITNSARRGWDLFNTKARCNKCHALTDTQRDPTNFRRTPSMNPPTPENALASSAMITAPSQDVSRDRQAYQILHWGFTALPILAGLDKFLQLLTDWHRYLAPQFAVFGTNPTMHIVGIIEMIAGLGIALKPRLFAPVVAVWLWGIIASQLLLGNYYDVALRDFGLSLGALALVAPESALRRQRT